MSDKPTINNNIETGGLWIAWVLVLTLFYNFDDYDFDLYDLIYQLLSKQIGN